MSRRELTFGGQVTMDRMQSDYFNQLHGHNGWVDNHQSLQSRTNVGPGVRSTHGGPMNSLSHAITGTLDPFTSDLSVPPSQLSYTTGYVSNYGTPSQREF